MGRNSIISGGGQNTLQETAQVQHEIRIQHSFSLENLENNSIAVKFLKNIEENKMKLYILDHIGRMKLSAALIGSTMAVDRPEPVTYDPANPPVGTKRPHKNIHIKDDMYYSPSHLQHLERQVLFSPK